MILNIWFLTYDSITYLKLYYKIKWYDNIGYDNYYFKRWQALF